MVLELPYPPAEVPNSSRLQISPRQIQGSQTGRCCLPTNFSIAAALFTPDLSAVISPTARHSKAAKRLSEWMLLRTPHGAVGRDTYPSMEFDCQTCMAIGHVCLCFLCNGMHHAGRSYGTILR